MNIKLRYTPVYSYVKYLEIKLKKRLVFDGKNIGKKAKVNTKSDYTIFREVYLRTEKNQKKEGQAVFQVVFHIPKDKMDQVIQRTDYTIPFFIGLPGFCNKQFMVNRQECTFSGKYEWENAELAQNYVNSYACRFMARRSKPYPLYYRIIDKATGQIIKESES